MSHQVTVRRLGLQPYTQVLESMRAFTDQRDESTADELWVLEHEPVFTLGQAGRMEHVLAAGSIPVIKVERGGQVTYHGPGQVVLYTLVDLRRRHVFVKEFVALLEDVVLEVLGSYGISGACRKPGAPGIYVPPEALAEPAGPELAKIAALGIKVRNGCAYHGVALNVAMDLSPFLGINPCGYEGLRTVDMAACGVTADSAEAGERLAECFARAWQRIAVEA